MPPKLGTAVSAKCVAGGSNRHVGNSVTERAVTFERVLLGSCKEQGADTSPKRGGFVTKLL